MFYSENENPAPRKSERGKMNIARRYFQEQSTSEEFRQSYLEEKTKLDSEYHLEKFKQDIKSCKPVNEPLAGDVDISDTRG